MLYCYHSISIFIVFESAPLKAAGTVLQWLLYFLSYGRDDQSKGLTFVSDSNHHRVLHETADHIYCGHEFVE